jgi:hypothetical protein
MRHKAFKAIFIVMVLFFIPILFRWSMLHFSPQDIKKIESIERVYLERNDETKVLNESEWITIREAILKINKKASVGMKGENWTYHCNLVIEVNSKNSYILSFQSRPSNKAVIPVNLQRGNLQAQWRYATYDGTALLNTINEAINPNKGLQSDKNFEKLNFCR